MCVLDPVSTLHPPQLTKSVSSVASLTVIVLERFTRSSGLSFLYFWHLHDEVEGGSVTTFQHDTPQSPHVIEELAFQHMSG